MMYKAPKLERKHLLALKILVHLDYARAVRFKLEALKKDFQESAEDATVKLNSLADILLDTEQPILITLAMMETHGATEAWIPLTEERFKFYRQTLDVEVRESDFRNLPDQAGMVAFGALKDMRVELQGLFDKAQMIDPEQMLGGSARDAAPVGKLLN